MYRAKADGSGRTALTRHNDPLLANLDLPRLEGFSLSKGTVRFTPDHPVPEDVVEEMVRLRQAKIDRILLLMLKRERITQEEYDRAINAAILPVVVDGGKWFRRRETRAAA